MSIYQGCRDESDNEARRREYRRLLTEHTKAERAVEALLRELRHSMPSERAEIKADLRSAQIHERQLRDELHALEQGRAA
jgi:hypothetical protein